MAVTKLWPVKTNLAHVIDYVKNPEKTDGALRAVLEYASDEDKTDHAMFTEGINCNVKKAAELMENVKRTYHKEGGVLAWHGYISFKETDITPELAHKVGIEFAQQLWGEKYQVVVATHLNTDHLHCHFVVNSVSFVDGKRAHDETSWFKFNTLADRLCRKYGLSVTQKEERNHPAEYQKRENLEGKPTPWNLAKAALDEAIAKSMTMPQLEAALRGMGYSFDFNSNHMYWTIVPKGRKKSVRLYRLGEQYTPNAIQHRLLENRMQQYRGQPLYAAPEQRKPKQYRRSRTPIAIVRKRSVKHRGLAGMYLYYRYRLGKLPKKRKTNPARVPWQIRDALMRLNEIFAQTELLVHNHIETKADMESYLHGVGERITELTAERAELRNKIRRVGITEKGKRETKEKIADISVQLKELRRDIKLCAGIAERSGVISEQLKELRQQEQRQKQERTLKPKKEERYYKGGLSL